MLTHTNVATNVLQDSHPDLLNYGEDETFVSVLPFFHCYGMSGIMFHGLYYGCRQVVLPKFDPKIMINVLRKYRPTWLHLVPPLVSFMVGHPDVKVDDLSSVKYIRSAAAPLSPNLAQQLMNKIGNPNTKLQESWGMTELSPSVTTEPWRNPVLGKCGVAIPNTEMKVVDLNTGAALGPEQDGEICVRGPQVMKGYHKNPTATSATIDAEGWCHSGDIGHYDKDGHFQIVDRLKELIKVKGLQVAPAELEDVLLSHASVSEAAVIGVPHEKSGEVPRAYVVRRDNVSEQDIAKFVAEKVARHKHLDGGVVFIDSIPKTASGKILRKDLKELFKKEK